MISNPFDPGACGSILVVEDDYYLRRVLVRTLEGWGFTTREASDGGAALDYVSNHGEVVSLILLDIMLPVLNGVEVARRVLQDRPSMHIIACSAAMTEGLMAELEVVGVRNFLMKPYTADSLKESVHRALAQDTQAEEPV